jgi:hypothetical protein
VDQELLSIPEHPYIIVCPFVLFILVIVLSVLRFTASDYSFGVFELFFANVFSKIVQS